MSDTLLASFFMPKNKTYFVYLNYFATGEGMIDAFGFFYAKNPTDAKRQLIVTTMCSTKDTPESIDACVGYFGLGAETYNCSNKKDREKAKIILSSFLIQTIINAIFATIGRGMLKQSFHLHRNLS